MIEEGRDCFCDLTRPSGIPQLTGNNSALSEKKNFYSRPAQTVLASNFCAVNSEIYYPWPHTGRSGAEDDDRFISGKHRQSPTFDQPTGTWISVHSARAKHFQTDFRKTQAELAATRNGSRGRQVVRLMKNRRQLETKQELRSTRSDFPRRKRCERWIRRCGFLALSRQLGARRATISLLRASCRRTEIKVR